jgi:hypothetical protein
MIATEASVGYPKIDVRETPNGSFSVWCRGCRTERFAFDQAAVKSFRRRHERCREGQR